METINHICCIPLRVILRLKSKKTKAWGFIWKRNKHTWEQHSSSKAENVPPAVHESRLVCANLLKLWSGVMMANVQYSLFSQWRWVHIKILVDWPNLKVINFNLWLNPSITFWVIQPSKQPTHTHNLLGGGSYSHVSVMFFCEWELPASRKKVMFFHFKIVCQLIFSTHKCPNLQSRSFSGGHLRLATKMSFFPLTSVLKCQICLQQTYKKQPGINCLLESQSWTFWLCLCLL